MRVRLKCLRGRSVTSLLAWAETDAPTRVGAAMTAEHALVSSTQSAVHTLDTSMLLDQIDESDGGTGVLARPFQGVGEEEAW